MSALELNNIGKRFGNFVALDGVSLSLNPGEILGYLGPNGAGKTTTIRIALGLVHPSNGFASVLGLPPSNPGSRTRVGFLPGELRLYGSMTAEQMLRYLSGFRAPAEPRLRHRLLDLFEIDASILRRRIKTLSHGTRQKIGLVSALAHDPDLLILDEPTNGLDPVMQQVFRDVVQECAQRGKAVFLSSHILSEADALCHRIAMLHHGRLVAVESVDRMRASMVRRAHVTFRSQAPGHLSTLQGVLHMDIRGREAEFTFAGDPNILIRWLAQTDVEQIVFPEPQLEEIFFHYFNGRSDARGT